MQLNTRLALIISASVGSDVTPNGFCKWQKVFGMANGLLIITGSNHLLAIKLIEWNSAWFRLLLCVGDYGAETLRAEATQFNPIKNTFDSLFNLRIAVQGRYDLFAQFIVDFARQVRPGQPPYSLE